MGDNNYVKEITNMEEDFSQWYTDVVLKAGLVDYAMVKGSMVLKPHGYQIWEQIKSLLDQRLKETNHENVYFPLLIPESLLNKEKEHVEGFAPEVAWVTEGGQKSLEERLCIRPTSETLFSTMFSKWVKSWRDLPLLYNQWCNVVRWEKTTRPFLRTSEFLWQEGHTVHATEKESKEETMRILDIYSDFVQKELAIPVLKGKKTEKEKFAGAVNTYTIETMMHDGKALQSGTSHNFGQNFSKPFDIKYQDSNGQMQYCWQTSWGVSTRLIGALIMVHGDNRGLVLPPRIAPIQIVITPIAQHKDGVMETCREVFDRLKNNLRIKIDDREQYSVGWKFNEWEMKGVPLRLEIGPRDIKKNQAIIVRRDTGEKIVQDLDSIGESIDKILQDIQKTLYENAYQNMSDRTSQATTMEQFEKNIDEKQGFIKAMWCGNVECEEEIKERTGATSRCIPFEQEKISDKCVCCGREAEQMVVFARAY